MVSDSVYVLPVSFQCFTNFVSNRRLNFLILMCLLIRLMQLLFPL